ncbi:VWA domain-containing protein [Ruminococcus flavefaciens]|uniref:VWA domain containing CoxE-like protein n=1 Tax=Ruminococcus flavefaciens TaxID=1265 RepID=A0A1M7JB16_RUMFL|nr:VWA domain-containing protein [Ruminococcus flavefaciens]SHM50206.1 VWA domain containing CoxE-like protein [Ruminococcus flavefaciens]
MEHQQILKRWRLILGAESQDKISTLGGAALSQEDILMDSALSQIYGSSSSGKGGKLGGHGASSPQLTKWLGDLRTLFSPMEIKVIQKDAIERKGLKQLLFEPEMLDGLEPDISTASLLLMLKDQIPAKAKDNARAYIAKIVEDINRRLSDDLRRSVTAALNRREHSPIPSASALDYKMTIRRNLKNYDPQRKVLLPEKFYFFERAAKSASRTVILDIDQSGSMGESAIYSSIMGCILASINALKTHIIAFDTAVNDLSDLCSDPVELLYGIQLGGGTDINMSVAYCQELITEPSKTTMFIVTDLYEGGNRAQLERRLSELKASGVNVIVLLAISDSGKPCYDTQLAEKVSAMDIPCFACPPEKLPELLDAALKKRSLKAFVQNVYDKK